MSASDIEADVITGRVCSSCGGGITPEDRVPHGGFWLCMVDCQDWPDDDASEQT